jgi:hypothetical protein
MMSRWGTFLIFLLLIVVAPFANASITGWNCDDDGDGAIVMDTPILTPVGGEYELTMDGVQHWFPAHVEGDFITDTPEDPTVNILEDIENSTTFAWTDYHIAFGMVQSFTFVSATMPSGWTAVISSVTPGQIPNGGPMGYVGTIDYYQSAGLPINIGDIGTFGFKVSFFGSTAFSTEQIPTPEPTTIALLGIGAISVIRRRRA